MAGKKGGGRRVGPGLHDALFRALLESPERAGALLRGHLPAEFRDRLSGDPPKLEDATFVSEELRSTQSDRLFSVKLKGGGTAFVYALLEHKSAPDPATPLQLLGYMVSIWKRHAGGEAARFRALPPIVPLVFHHGRRRWTEPLSVLEAIDADEGLRPLVNSMRYTVHELRDIDPARLSAGAGRGTVAGLLLLGRRGGASVALLVEIMDAIGEEDLNLRNAALKYILEMCSLPRETLERAMREAGAERWEKPMKTIYEQILQEGRQAGRQEGRQEALTDLLEGRFGSLPDWARERIAGGSSEQLHAWFMSAINADSLDTLFSAGAQN